jgi:hypothetical protein
MTLVDWFLEVSRIIAKIGKIMKYITNLDHDKISRTCFDGDAWIAIAHVLTLWCMVLLVFLLWFSFIGMKDHNDLFPGESWDAAGFCVIFSLASILGVPIITFLKRNKIRFRHILVLNLPIGAMLIIAAVDIVYALAGY